MRDGSTYRWHRKAVAKSLGEPLAPAGRKDKLGIGKRMKWLSRHTNIAGMYPIALNILRNSERASMPTWRAIKKMTAILATQPRMNVPGLGRVPFMLTQGMWERGTWRSYPHIVIDANLKVQK
jgi:hypothetical protein